MNTKISSRLFALLSLFNFLIFSKITHAQTAAAPRETALAHLRANAEKFGLTASDVSEVRVTDEFFSSQTGLTHVWVQQFWQGIPVHKGLFGLHVRPDGEVLTTGHRFVSRISEKINTSEPTLGPQEALAVAAENLGFPASELPQNFEKPLGNSLLFPGGNFSKKDIEVVLGYLPSEDGSVRLAWSFFIETTDGLALWNYRVDAQNGLILSKVDLISHCVFENENDCQHETQISEIFQISEISTASGVHQYSPPNAAGYRVFPLPTESPAHGPRVLVSDPADAVASPFGWHDTNGAAGAEFTTTRGNNARAYEDIDNNNQPPTTEVDGGAGLVFDFPFDPAAEPETNKNASVTNLFYVVNRTHDIAYRLGFDEKAGNFQQNNYGNGGLGNDPVLAEALDGDGTDNARFIPSPDGSTGRLEMFKWSGTKLLTVNQPASVVGQYLARAASGWGAPITTTPVSGQVVEVNDGVSNPTSLGCAQPVNDVAGKIALVDRGDCTYGEKALFAQQKGAIGCIVCNYENQLKNMSVGAFGAQVTIPVITIRKVDCDVLRQFARAGTLHVSLVRPPASGPEFLDGALDNGTIIHEYAHGISNRLTGGPSSFGCLDNGEQMGEGWSDFFALALTARQGDTGTKPRGVGAYLYREGANGGGIRRFPYTTDMAANPLTFSNVAHNTQVHALGEVWCSMLWDLYWAMTDKYGWSADFTSTTAGNVRALRLVMEGMKLQPCGPGFVDGRDAILKADQMLYGSQNQCLIWQVFARRGLGFGASQGSNNNPADGTASFELPLECDKRLILKKTSTPLIDPGQDVQFTLTVTNGKDAALSNLKITDDVPAGLTVQPASISNGGFATSSKVTWNLGTLQPKQSVTVSYTASSDPTKGSLRLLLHDFESFQNLWKPENLDASAPYNFYGQAIKAHSGQIGWKGDNPSVRSNYVLKMDNSRTVSGARPAFRFWQAHDTEAGFDGGFLEISTDGGASWQILKKEKFIRNAYTGGLDYFGLAIPYLDGFSGKKTTFYDSYLDLKAYAGQNVRLRFRFGSSEFTGGDGWYLDDFEWLDLFSYEGQACATTGQGDNVCATAPQGGTIVNFSTSVPTEEPTDEPFGIAVRPNPASGLLHVASNRDLPGETRLSLLAADGKLVKSLILNDLQAAVPVTLELGGVAPGIYFLKMEGKNGVVVERVAVW